MTVKIRRNDNTSELIGKSDETYQFGLFLIKFVKSDQLNEGSHFQNIVLVNMAGDTFSLIQYTVSYSYEKKSGEDGIHKLALHKLKIFGKDLVLQGTSNE